mmetsp:Transcript_103539/g.270340  ORF Transcript_103539/g.270340 Transcript_103539/m.270340 type:complete len:354 (-) Transcript_103539:485-1546(-)
MQPNFILVRLPKFPVSTCPVCSPIRISSCGRPMDAKCWLRYLSATCCASAAAHALVAWLRTLSGVFQKTRRPSPSISPTVPSYASTMCVMTEKYRVRRKSILRGLRWANCSDRLVKSLMSENIIVAQRLSTYNLVARLSPCTMRCTTVSGTKRANRTIHLVRRSNVSCSCAISCMFERLPRQNLENSSESIERLRVLNFSMSSLSLPSSLNFRDIKMPTVPTIAVPTPSTMRSATTIMRRVASHMLCNSSCNSRTPCSIADCVTGSSGRRCNCSAYRLNTPSAFSASIRPWCSKKPSTTPKHAADISAKKAAPTTATDTPHLRVGMRASSSASCCSLTMVAGVRLKLLPDVEM